MIKKTKRTQNFHISGNELVINLNGEILNLHSSDIKDFWFNQETYTIVIAYKLDKVTLNLISLENFLKFRSEFLVFFPYVQFHTMKRKIVKRLMLGGGALCTFAIYLYLYHFDNFSALVYLFLGITFFGVINTFNHIKSINKFFEQNN